MQKERAARALESGLPVQTPLPGMLSSRPPSSRPSASTRRARLTLVLVTGGLVGLCLLYGAWSLIHDESAAAASAPSASAPVGASFAASLRTPPRPTSSLK